MPRVFELRHSGTETSGNRQLRPGFIKRLGKGFQELVEGAFWDVLVMKISRREARWRREESEEEKRTKNHNHS